MANRRRGRFGCVSNMVKPPVGHVTHMVFYLIGGIFVFFYTRKNCVFDCSEAFIFFC